MSVRTASATIVYTKPRRVFYCSPFGGISQVGSVCGEMSTGKKIRFFSRQDTPARKNVYFFLPNNSWQGFIKAFSLPWPGICTFWQDKQDWPRRGKMLHFFLPVSCTATNIDKPPRLSLYRYPSITLAYRMVAISRN